MKIAVLPGDGIGTEIVSEAVKVLEALDLKFEMESALVGGAAYEAHGHPLPESTLKLAKEADAILFGAVGDWKYDKLDRPLRPEQAILGLRKNLGLFANFRPAICYEQLVGASSLKPELIAGLDILIIRELTGDIYFGQPRGRRVATDGHFPGAEEAFDTMRYSRPEIERIAHVAFQAARKRNKKVTSVDKANVLETFQFWKDVVTDVHKEYPDVELQHMYVDNAAMQLVKAPKAFDVVVTGNMFGDILSDEASMLTGSIGMLPSASLNSSNQGLYEPSHGSAPDIAGKGVANPLATILSAAMMLRFSLNQEAAAQRIEPAVQKVLAQGLRTPDIYSEGTTKVGTAQMGDAVVKALTALSPAQRSQKKRRTLPALFFVDPWYCPYRLQPPVVDEFDDGVAPVLQRPLAYGCPDLRNALCIRRIAINTGFQRHAASPILYQDLVVGMAAKMFWGNLQHALLNLGMAHGPDITGYKTQRLRHAHGRARHRRLLSLVRLGQPDAIATEQVPTALQHGNELEHEKVGVGTQDHRKICCHVFQR